MALSATIVWEVRSGGSDTNGGGFKTGASGTDWTQQDAAQYSVTDAVTDGSSTITSATANFGTDVVGNVLYIQGGSGSITAGWYEITTRNSATSITVDRSTGLSAGTGATLKIGGGFASPGQAAGVKVAGNDVYIKYGTYTLTTSSSNVSGGIVNDTTGGVDQTNYTYWIGYDTTRTLTNTDANRPTIAVPGAGVSSVTVFRQGASFIQTRNLIVDGNSKTAIVCFANAGNYGLYMENCKASNFTSSGFTGAGAGLGYVCYRRCAATGGTSAATAGFNASAVMMYCESYNNACVGFTGVGFLANCIASGQTNSADGFSVSGFAGTTLVNCVSHGNAGDGFDVGTNYGYGTTFSNCIAYGNGGYGFGSGATDFQQLVALTCAAGSNTSGNVRSTLANFSVTALTADPFTNAGGGDFSLNNTAGGGAACRAAGFPGVMPRGTSTGYLDIGAIQHQDSGGTTFVYQIME